MDFSSSKSLARELVLMKLVTKEQANTCLRQLDRDHRTGSDLLQVLHDENMLTPFQIECLRKLDTDILILGGNKLLYPNASGSFARVFRGENLETGQTVAVKVLRNRWNNDPVTVNLFRREAELGQKLKHPNIVAIYEIGFEAGYHFFTMEFIEGGNLRDFVQIRKQIEPLETIRYSIDMARGLEYALRFGMTHRDLKTTNVVFTMDGSAKLIDFGLATDDELIKQIGEANVQHALEYSTLEKGTGAPRNDPRSDLYFLGTIMYEMLLGEAPYPRTRSREERKQISRYRNIRPLSQALPQCPPFVTEIVDRLLKINPAERYQSATELIRDLTEAKVRLEQEQRKTPTPHAAPMPGTSSKAFQEPPPPTLLCIERRSREQDLLRDYFTRHGFRVLMLADSERASKRILTDPPDVVLFMAMLANPQELTDRYTELTSATLQKQIPTLVVVPDQQLMNSTPQQDLIELKQQPLALRDLRQGLLKLSAKNGQPLTLKKVEE